jgi:nucleolar GTP-binding protein
MKVQFDNQRTNFIVLGVMDVRNLACNKLLAARVEQKLKGTKIQSVINKLHLAQPVARDDKVRPPCIPPAALAKKKFDLGDTNRPKLAKEIEQENGGAGVFNVDLKSSYILKNEEWKYDKIPEIMDGKNVADFIDPEIQEKLDALEREEDRLIAEGFYNSDDEIEDDETTAINEAAAALKAKKDIIIQKHREGKGRNKPALPKKALARVCFANHFNVFI